MRRLLFYKIWKVIEYEFTRNVLRWRFWLGILSLPVMLLFAFLYTSAMLPKLFQQKPVGLVDYSGLAAGMSQKQISVQYQSFDFTLLPNEAEARSALQAQQIQAYYVVPADFLKNIQARLVYKQRPSTAVSAAFDTLIRERMLAGIPAERARRLLSIPLVVTRLIGSEEEDLPELVRIVFPLLAGYLLILSITSCTGYVIHAVSEEEANRTLEILVTSLSPEQLMVGKIIGLTCTGLTQMLIWLLPALGVLPLILLSNLPVIRSVISWEKVLVFGMLALPAFLLVSSLVASLALTVLESTEGQLLSSGISIFNLLPILLVPLISSAPDGVVSTILTYFPLTSALTVLIRIGFSGIAPWQIGLAVVVLNLSAGGAIWLAGRILRLNMLRAVRTVPWKRMSRAVLERIRHYA